MEKKKAITKLVLAELFEGLVPLAFAICFAIAYYGPNAKLLGNVQNGYWQYKAVDDVSRTFLVMSGMFTMDLLSLFLNAIILWLSCKLNIFKEICSVLQKYWYIMALKLTNNAYLYFASNDVNLAMDLTLKFRWITNDKNFNSTSNSTSYLYWNVQHVVLLRIMLSHALPNFNEW